MKKTVKKNTKKTMQKMQKKNAKFDRIFTPAIISLLLILISVIIIPFDDYLYKNFSITGTDTVIPDFLSAIILFFQEDLLFGILVLLIGVLIIRYHYKGTDWRNGKKEYTSFFLSFFAVLIFSSLMKILILRPRPELIFGIDSYPSNHSAVLFSLIPFIKSKKIKFFYILFAVLIMASRFLFGYHFISDLFAGAGIGLMISTLCKEGHR